eukprot:5813928-Amphidinium_carterae.1
MASIPTIANPYLFLAAHPEGAKLDFAHMHHRNLTKMRATVIYLRSLPEQTLLAALGFAAHRLGRCKSPWAVASCAAS